MAFLFGDSTIANHKGTMQPSYMQGCRAYVGAACRPTTLKVWVDNVYAVPTVVTLHLAIYSDDGLGRPNSLLATGHVQFPANEGGAVRSAPVDCPWLAPGYYWLMLRTPSGGMEIDYNTSGGLQYYRNNVSSWPNPEPGGGSTNACSITLYAEGDLNSAPNAPTSLANTNGSLTPTFTATATDPDTGDSIAQAQVVVERVSDGQQMWDSGAFGSTGSISKLYAGSTLSYGVQYRWKVRAQDSHGEWGAWSEYATFTLAHAAPTPTSLSPTGRVTTLTPTFTGTMPTDPDGHTLAAYQIILYASDQGAVIWDSGELATGVSGADFSTLYNGAALAWGTQYYWKARAKCSNGQWSVYSALQAMNTNAAPTAAANMAPPNDATVDTLTPVLSWTFQDPDAGDSQGAFQVEIRLVSDESLVYDSTKTTSEGQSHVVPGATLTKDVQYKWRVKCWDSADREGAWSDYQTFTCELSLRTVSHAFYEEHTRLALRYMGVRCYDATSWELKGEAETDANGVATFADLPASRRYVLMPKKKGVPVYDERQDAESLGGYEASEYLRPVWLESPVIILAASTYTTDVATPTALDISSAVPVAARWALMTLGVKDSGAPPAWYSVGINNAEGVHLLHRKTQIANIYNDGSEWIPVTNQQVYFRRDCVGTMTVVLRVNAWSP
jgi:hypothetical protein